MMSNRATAEAALRDIVQAVEAEAIAAGDRGLRNDQVARALGLETSVNGGQRNHLTHAILNMLVEEGRLQRRKEGARVFYHL
jgi:hypothetical protein